MPKCSIPQRVKTLETLLTITSNILRPPQATSSSKFRQLRMNNSMIVRNIMEVNGAYDYLSACPPAYLPHLPVVAWTDNRLFAVACGFRKSIEQFVPYLTLYVAPFSLSLAFPSSIARLLVLITHTDAAHLPLLRNNFILSEWGITFSPTSSPPRAPPKSVHSSSVRMRKPKKRNGLGEQCLDSKKIVD